LGKLAFDSSIILSNIQNKPIEQFLDLETELKFAEGKEKERIVKQELIKMIFVKEFWHLIMNNVA